MGHGADEEVDVIHDVEEYPDEDSGSDSASAASPSAAVAPGMRLANHEAPLSERLKEVAIGFAPLGLIAFGGPAAHIGILQQAFVEKRQWLDSERFVELMAVGQGLPGPTSTQMVIAIGATRAGLMGGVVAFLLWNLPSFIVLVTFALVSRERIEAATLPDYMIGLPASATVSEEKERESRV